MTVFKIENEKNLVKDMNSKAVLNNDTEQLLAYKKRKQKLNQQNDEIKELKDKMSSLENKVDLVLDLLLKR